MKIQPDFAQAYANLADIYRAVGDEDKAGETLERGLKILPNEDSLHYAMGLRFIRLKHYVQGMAELKLATELAAGNRVFAYGYGLGLYSTGQKGAAFTFMQQRLAKYPNERNNLYLMIHLAGQERRQDLIEPYHTALVQLSQSDPRAKQLLDTLPDTSNNPAMAKP